MHEVAKDRRLTQMGPPHFFGVDLQLPTMVVVSLCREVLGVKCPVTSASSLKEALVSHKKNGGPQWMVCSAVGGWLLRLANNVLLMAATAHGSALVGIVHHVRSASICSTVSKGEWRALGRLNAAGDDATERAGDRRKLLKLLVDRRHCVRHRCVSDAISTAIRNGKTASLK
jgi:hypothetical protein